MSLKKHLYSILATLLIVGYSVYALLKTFVLQEALAPVVASTTTQTTSSTGVVTITDNSYQDDNMSIQILKMRVNDTDVYVADIKVSSPEFLKTALAKNTFGTNITSTTSETAQANNAIFAVNGDYYGANTTGYVIKNGVLYRDSHRSSSFDDLFIYKDGHFEVANESTVSAQQLVQNGVVQSFAFGPTLVKDSQIAVSQNTEVAQAMANNPRTAIGIIDDLHYIVVVSDGRTSQSQGLTLYELAQVMQQQGATLAYNLDGGGSSTMYFNGKVINNPTTNGNTIKERGVSDIVYFGY